MIEADVGEVGDGLRVGIHRGLGRGGGLPVIIGMDVDDIWTQVQRRRIDGDELSKVESDHRIGSVASKVDEVDNVWNIWFPWARSCTRVFCSAAEPRWAGCSRTGSDPIRLCERRWQVVVLKSEEQQKRTENKDCPFRMGRAQHD